MKRESIFGVLTPALLLLVAWKAIQRRIRGWFVAPLGASRRARLLVVLPRFCRQSLRRLGLTLPVFEASVGQIVMGTVGPGKAQSGLEALREQLKPGESAVFFDFTGYKRSAQSGSGGSAETDKRQ